LAQREPESLGINHRKEKTTMNIFTLKVTIAFIAVVTFQTIATILFGVIYIMLILLFTPVLMVAYFTNREWAVSSSVYLINEWRK
jgi:hypothetical protein